MQVIQIKPSNRLHFKIPTSLTCKFTIGNLTLRSVCIFAVPMHPQVLSISPKVTLVEAFQETEVIVTLNWSQALSCGFKSKIRVYIWELYDEEYLSTVASKMFDKQTDGNCLLFEEINIDIEFDTSKLKPICGLVPHTYLVQKIQLPNAHHVQITEEVNNKVLKHCQKLGKVKAIYTHGSQYIVEFANPEDIICSFCEVRDKNDRLAIFGIKSILSFGSVICSPDILFLSGSKDPKSHSKKQIKKSPKEYQSAITSTKQVQQEKQENYKSQIVQISQFQTPNNPTHKTIKNREESQIRDLITTKSKRDFVKQSFAPSDRTKQPTRKRARSQQLISQCEENDNSSEIDIQSWRNAYDFTIKSQKIYEEKSIDFSKKILNMELSADEKYVYLVLRDCIMICEVNLASKRVIKFDPIDSENTSLPTPMLVLNKERTIIFGNESYLFWVSLVGDEESDWKYVQRKEIYAIEVIEELNLLMVGGKNFSKLAYLGKSTQRSNIKVYSSGKTGKKDHLFTYDLPSCTGQHIIEMKYITTKPNGAKLLLTVTHNSKMFFLRVRAFDRIEVYSCLDANQIGIQQIISMKYYYESSILVCLEKLAEGAMCFKFVKVNCSYEKVEISTESVKIPVAKYLPWFRVGGRLSQEWLTAVDCNNNIYCLYLSQSQAQKKQCNTPLKDWIVLKNGAIFRQVSQLRCRILKQ